MNDSKGIGIFWDYENVHAWEEGGHIPLAEKILEKLSPKGVFKQLLVYGKWDPDDDIIKGLYTLGFKPIIVPMTIKNSADIKLAVDCIASSYEHDIQVYAIISADKDFIPVINHLKSKGKEVIVFALRRNSSNYITISPDDFIDVESLVIRSSKQNRVLSKQNSNKYGKRKFYHRNRNKKDASSIEYDELKKIFNKVTKDLFQRNVSIALSAIHTALQSETNNRYLSYSRVKNPTGKYYSKFSQLVLDLIIDLDYVIIDDQLIQSQGQIDTSKKGIDNESPIILEWMKFFEYIEEYCHEDSKENSIFSRLNLINKIQNRIIIHENRNVPRSEINDKIELLVNLGIMVEDPDLNFQLAHAYKIKQEQFLKSFKIPMKQTSLMESLV